MKEDSRTAANAAAVREVQGPVEIYLVYAARLSESSFEWILILLKQLVLTAPVVPPTPISIVVIASSPRVSILPQFSSLAGNRSSVLSEFARIRATPEVPTKFSSGIV